MKLILLVASSLIFSAYIWADSKGYNDHGLSVSSADGIELFSNKDVKCVSIEKGEDGKNQAKFTLNDYARHLFREYTSKNIGKKIQISTCWGPGITLRIAGPISGGIVLSGPLTLEKETCLKSTFELNKGCSDCPVCKN